MYEVTNFLNLDYFPVGPFIKTILIQRKLKRKCKYYNT